MRNPFIRITNSGISRQFEKSILLILSVGTLWIGESKAQSVSVTSPANCFAATFVFNYDAANSPDATGRNVYFYSNSSLEIRFNSGANRWEIRARGGNFDVYYINFFASSPNPPDNVTSAWEDFGFCDNTGAPTVTGSGTQSTIGGDPCSGLGGDSDGDGACDDNDICPGFDDFADQDSDGIPDGCDANPTVPDGVLVDASCLDPDPILFTLSGTDGTGRNVYSTAFANGLEVRYNPTSGRWEVRASGGGMDVYLFNNFASWPDPPGSAGTWQGTSILNCNTAPTPIINGSGTQNTLGCTISIGNPSVTQPICGGDGVISVTASGAKGAITYTLKQGVATLSTNGTGIFSALSAGTYTILAEDGAFPPGVCTAQTSSIALVVQDNINPTASNPASTNVSCTSQVPPVNTAVVIDEADNCGTPTVSFQGETTSGTGNQASPLVIVRTYRVTDVAGNFTDVTHTITVIDNIAPSITCPSNIIITATTGQCSGEVAYPIPTASDNCSGASVSRIAGLASGAVFPVGTTLVTYEAEDAVGNTRQCSFTVIVNDQEDPLIVCPSNIVLANEAGLCNAAVVYTPPMGVDNCPGATTMRVGGLGPGATFPVGVTTETFLVTDASGNTDDCSFTVTVNDTELPAISCPGNISLPNDPNACGAVVTYMTPIGTDNCPGATTQRIFGLGSGAFFPVGLTVEKYEVSDANGNKNTCEFTVAVQDSEAPVITQAESLCGGNFVLPNVMGDCYQQFVWTTPTASDNCAIVSFSRQISNPTVQPLEIAGTTLGLFPVGTTTITYTASDAASNTAICSFTVEVVDQEPPILECVNSYAVNLEADGTLDLLQGQTQQATYLMTLFFTKFEDNCFNDLGFVGNDHPANLQFDCGDLGDNFVQFSAKDLSGNLAYCTVNIIVADPLNACNSAPVASCKDIFVNADGNCEASITAAQINDNSFDPDGDDLIFSLNNTGPLSKGLHTVELSVSDGQETDKCTATVTVLDVTPPVKPAAPAPVTGSCIADVPTEIVLTAIDACDGPITVGPTTVKINGTCANRFVMTRTWTFTDLSGNSSSVSQTITISDETGPTLTTPPNVTIECDESTLPSHTGNASATDNCDGTVIPGYSDSFTDIQGDNCYTILRTWTATDACGNSNSKVQRIIVQDTHAPFPPPAPGDLMVECSSEVPLAVDLTAQDNCDGAITVSPTDEVTPGNNPNDFTLVRTWTFTDVCGNSASIQQTISVADITPPVIHCPDSTVLEIENSCQIPLPDLTQQAVVSDNCAATEDIVVTQTPPSGTLIGPGTTVVTLKAIDQAGNMKTCTTGVTVLAGTDLVEELICPSDITVFADCMTGLAQVNLPAPSFPLICVQTSFKYRHRKVDINNVPIGSFSPYISIAISNTAFAAGRYEIEWQVTDQFGTLNCHYYLQVNAVIPQTPIVGGPVSVCQNLTGIPYSVATQAGISNYQWSYSGNGVSIQQNGGTDVLLDFAPEATSGVLSVVAINPCGEASPAGTLDIEVGNALTCLFTNCLVSNLYVYSSTLQLPGMPRIFKVGDQITSNASLPAPEMMIFKAGTTIQLDPGFTINHGAIFQAQIEGCSIFGSANGGIKE